MYEQKIIRVKMISFLVILLFFVAKSSAAKDALTFYAVDFPPYEFENPRSPDLRGFDVDVILESFKRVNIDVKIRFLPWKRIVSFTKDGTIAGMVSCARKKERDSYIYYSEPISYSTHAFIVTDKYQGRELKVLEDAKGLRNLVVAGYTSEIELKKAGIGYEKAMTDQLAIARLLERPYDTFYSSRETVEYMAKENSFSKKIKIFDIVKFPFHLCIGKKWANAAQLVLEFNRGLAMVKADGTYWAIHDKYR